MKQITAILAVAVVLVTSCSKRETPGPKGWTSSLSMDPIDTTTPEGRAVWSNAMAALRTTLSEQEAKVESMRNAAPTQTNDATFVADLDKQERILGALRDRLKDELANRLAETDQ